MNMIDLRSDTVTRPSQAMRAAMADAPVGDDQYGEDPSLNSLQERVAALLGKEAALFMPSGTMANQVALNILTNPGDDVLVPDESHLVWHETGAAAANSGVQFTVISRGGTFTADDVVRTAKPRGHIVFPPTSLVVIENTHNRAGGVIFPQADVDAIIETARGRGIASYLDGARLFNVAAATGAPVARLAKGFDLVGISLSKGLGCPVGGVIAGSADLIGKAVRVRRRFGGALRQAGILAAAGHYALDNNLGRLTEDHANVRLIAEALAPIDGIDLNLATVQTNIAVFHLKEGMPDAAEIVTRAKGEGLLIVAFGPRTIRLATHLDVDRAACEAAAGTLGAILKAG